MTISAELIAYSITHTGKPIYTFELEYPRIVHSELMTHRVFSRNSASSRAIPVKVMNDLIRNNVAMPIHFGKNKSGMQDDGEHDALINGMYTPNEWWDLAVKSALKFSEGFDEAGYHKQVCNRLTEAGQHMKIVMTTTDLENWFSLRYHPDADPTIAMLAVCMYEALIDSKPTILHTDEWHMPYYFDGYWSEDVAGVDSNGFTLEEALKISSSCCAQLSYRKSDESIEKARGVYVRLVESKPVHASPTEHQATPIPDVENPFNPNLWIEGVTHVTREGVLCSGNFESWLQHRQLIPDHVCREFVKE